MNIKDWLGEDNQLGIDIWEKKYRRDDETFAEWVDRVSGHNAQVAHLILDKKFLFAGRILSNRGVDDTTEHTTYSNCYVVAPPEDSIESIYDTCKKLARTYSYGGGSGINIGKLAPAGARVHNQAKTTSGAVSFMDTFSQVTEQIGQNGRRGALMISIPCDHPDVEEFIKVKTNLKRVNYANISVMVSDEFMNAVASDSDWKLAFTRKETGETIEKIVNANDLFDLICQTNWNYAEPGVLFWDRISNYNLLDNNLEFEYAGTNPCVTGDTLIHTTHGEVQIKDLVGKTPNVYCMGDDGTLTIRKASRVWKTRENAQLVAVETSRGYLRCTPAHLVHTRNRGWVAAQDLSRGDKISGLNWQMKDETQVSVGTNGIVKSVTWLKETEDVYDMTVPDTHNFIANRMVVHNCGEEPLPAGGSCLLGSLNLAAFVDDEGNFLWKDFDEAIYVAVGALNDVLEEGLEKHPLEEQKQTVRDWRQIGLGIMGLADMFIKMGVIYGSEKSLGVANSIGLRLAQTAIKASAELSAQRGAYQKYNDLVLTSSFFKSHMNDYLQAQVETYGLKNSQLLTIAPTGTISTMLGVSGGIEPIFANSYSRRTQSLYGEDVEYKVYTKIVDDYMKEHNIKDESDLPEYFVTAQDIDYYNRILMQSIWQTHIDASISSTINLPNSATVNDIKAIYMEAWKRGLKGITVYRAGCAREGILTKEDDKQESEQESKAEVKGRTIGLERHLTTGCGSLHICAYFDEEGNLKNTYLSKGSSGGCNNYMIGLSRIISLAAKNNVGIEDIVDQLHSCGTCPSYAIRRATKNDVSLGSCCPVAIGNALLEMWKEVNDGHSHYNRTRSSVDSRDDSRVQKDVISLCPECGGALKHEMGCVTCTACGFSKCG